ncbi:unnamed protein product [Hydatigera taeniaeformis]|uniref:Uncharacterized protein n=1 Tax=Hydatigena taeniaeformis TaxID=6205 RepID=A0A0R3WT17_HYDTA|nr:unnamed protein product [Hydatigera taeniaeformis]
MAISDTYTATDKIIALPPAACALTPASSSLSYPLPPSPPSDFCEEVLGRGVALSLLLSVPHSSSSPSGRV